MWHFHGLNCVFFFYEHVTGDLSSILCITKRNIYLFDFLSAGNEMKPCLHLSWTKCLGVLCNVSCRLHVDRNHAAASVSFVSA